MTLQRVDEMTSPPVVGRIYLVPCIVDDDNCLPVTGPAHADPELVPMAGPKARLIHYHYDRRFISKGFPYEFAVVRLTVAARIEWKPMRCLRKQPIPSFTFAVLEEKYANATMRGPCKVCPHRGIPLASLPVASDGTVTCPGHGLRFDVATGKLVRRTG